MKSAITLGLRTTADEVRQDESWIQHRRTSSGTTARLGEALRSKVSKLLAGHIRTHVRIHTLLKNAHPL